MPTWLLTLLAVVAVAALALLLGWSAAFGSAQRIAAARRLRRYRAMGSMLLGFGMVFDPPARHAVEASERRVSKGDENGDPPDPEHDAEGNQDG